MINLKFFLKKNEKTLASTERHCTFAAALKESDCLRDIEVITGVFRLTKGLKKILKKVFKKFGDKEKEVVPLRPQRKRE
jgi:hypothetical protein